MTTALKSTIPFFVQARFWSKVDQRGRDECWPWLSAVNHNGYGILTVKLDDRRRNLRATHLSLELDGRQRPLDLHALHSCDNPACVNAAHLRWGTNHENILDRMQRGRRGAPGAKGGEAHCNAKLTVEAVRVIRACNQNPRMLAHIYGVSRKTVYDIKARATWANVT